MADNLIEVRLSPGKGRGIFAKRDIKKGETIEIAPVLLVPTKDEPFIFHSFLQDYSFSSYDGAEECTAIGLGYSSLYNHAKKCNADYVCSTEMVIITAIKNIKKDSEVTIHYGWDKKHNKDVGIKE